MIWLINHTDPLGVVLHDLIQEQQQDVVAMTTMAMPRYAAIGQDQGREVLWWQGNCYPLEAMQLVYCGVLPAQSSGSIPSEKIKDWLYVTNAWQAWLRYGLARVPLSLGILPDTCWIDTWRHITSLASLAPRYGMLAPLYRYVQGASYGDNYAYLSSCMVDNVDCFSVYKDDSVLAVAIPDGHWLQCAWVGNTCYVIRCEQGHWVPYRLSHNQRVAIGQLTRAWGLSVCHYLMRQHKTGEIGLYGASPQLDAKIVSNYLPLIRHHLQKEYLAQCY